MIGIDIISLIISLVVALINIGIYILYNSKFVLRYKKYREEINKKIVEKYKSKILSLFKSKDIKKIEEEFSKISEELVNDNQPITIYDRINTLVKWDIILLGISALSNLLSMKYTSKIIDNFTFADIGFFSLIIGITMFFILIYNIFSLNRLISNYELGIEENKSD